MKKVTFIVLFIILAACSDQDPGEQLKNLNGYWQIEKVELAKDSVREYSLSQYVDYIEVNDSSGFRKKLRPNIDGSFTEASNDAEKIDFIIKDGELMLQYSTLYDEWTEKVIEADENKLVVINNDGKKYYYKRYEPLISFDEQEKK